MQKVDMKEFGDELEWYKENYRDQYDNLPFLMGEVKPEDQARYNHLCDMIEALRDQYHDYEAFRRTKDKNERIVKKQAEAVKKGKDWHWVIDQLDIGPASYKYSVTHDEGVAALHKQLMFQNKTRVIVTDMKSGRALKFNSISEAERAYGFSKSGLSQNLRRNNRSEDQILYRGRYKVERW